MQGYGASHGGRGQGRKSHAIYPTFLRCDAMTEAPSQTTTKKRLRYSQRDSSPHQQMLTCQTWPVKQGMTSHLSVFGSRKKSQHLRYRKSLSDYLAKRPQGQMALQMKC